MRWYAPPLVLCLPCLLSLPVPAPAAAPAPPAPPVAAAVPVQEREAAEDFSGRGDKALKEGDAEAAELEYARALEEDSSFRPARYGRAQALFRLGQGQEAAEELQRFVAEMRTEASPPPEWKNLLAKAEKQFAALDAAAAEVLRIVDKYADDLVALARKWAGKDPAVAERAARRALRLRPGDPRAQELLSRVDAAPKGPPVVLFNGADLKNWGNVEFPYFQVVDENVIGDVRAGSREIRTLQSFSGDYDITVEVKVLEDRTGGDPMFSLLGCYKGDNDFVGVGVINHKVYFFDRTSERNKKVLFKSPVAEWKTPLDLSQWNTFELRFREDEITALLNGEVIGSEERTEHRADGFVGLYAQWTRVAFRKVVLQKR